MREKLLEYLLCPQCSGELRLNAGVKVNGEIKEGSLICRICGRGFPAINHIPRFVPESNSRLFRQSWRNFGYSWRRFARIYADPRDFPDWIKPFLPDFFKERSVFDAGCGPGLLAGVPLSLVREKLWPLI